MAASTGISGLDDLLGGGLAENHLYLVQGEPGTGKTTLALQFLLEGRARGERVLYIALSESLQELISTTKSHGWSFEPSDIFELKAAQQSALGGDVSLFHPGELELGEAMKTLLDEVTKRDPHRVVFDSLSEIRLLAQEPLRYRRQILALKQHFMSKRCTVLLLDDCSTKGADEQVTSIAHGTILLSQELPDFGIERRRIRIGKMRGLKFRGGFHDYLIETGGLRVFPRLVAAEHRESVELGRVSSGNKQLDALLGGGLTRGTSTLITGPPGAGKSSLAGTFVMAAASRGEKSVTYLFDENANTYVKRCAGLGLDIKSEITRGRVKLQPIDPAELTPGEFIHRVRAEVEQGARVVVIDSLNGYLQSMPDERFLIVQLHEILTYLAQKGTMTFLITPQHGFIGTNINSSIEVSYLADTMILMRYFEALGTVRNSIAIVKQRTGHHERTIRELSFSSQGLSIGDALENFQGVLTGVPEYTGKRADLLKDS